MILIGRGNFSCDIRSPPLLAEEQQLYTDSRHNQPSDSLRNKGKRTGHSFPTGIEELSSKINFARNILADSAIERLIDVFKANLSNINPFLRV